MTATTLLSDNGVTSGITGYTLTGGDDGTLQLQTTTAGGTATTAMSIGNTQVVTFANPPEGVFPSGTAMLFKQTSAPTGWTKDTTAALNDSALRVVTGSVTTGGSVAFTTAFASQGVSGTVGSTTAGGSVSVTLSGGGSVSGTTLSTAQIPSHTHGVTYYNNDGDAYSPRGIGKTSYVSADGTQNTGAAGSGGSHSHGFSNPSYSGSFSGASHNHTFSGTAINLAVKYVDIIIATKA